MRLLQLGLLRFGPFTDQTLDFSSLPGALHLIHGPNEAGKSTSLRAITGLLYGIEARTKDAHLHPMKDLRLAGTLEVAQGPALAIVRRKGLKNTLSSAQGSALDEAELSRHLGGVGRDAFEQSFGLDAARLRAGGQALLEGHGDLGQSLFDAGTGGAGVQRLLAQLSAEADELYRKNASTKRINLALKELKEKKAQLRDAVQLPKTWAQQKRHLDEARAARELLKEERTAKQTEQERVKRAIRLAPLLRRRSALLGELGSLAEVPDLGADPRSRREAAERDLEDFTRQLEASRKRLARLEAERAQLVVPEHLIAIDDDEISKLEGVGNDTKAFVQDLPKRKAELATIHAEAESLAQELGRSLAEVRQLVVTEAQSARIAELSTEVPRGRGELQRDAAILKSELQVLQAEASPEAPKGEIRALDAALKRLRRVGDLDGRLRLAESELTAARLRFDRDATRLKAWCENPSELDALALPSAETVRHFAERADHLAHVEQSLTQRQERHAARDREVKRRELELLQAGSAPTETDLDDARKARDAHWQDVRRALEAPLDAKPTLAGQTLSLGFEALQQKADEVADRLRREADRVAQRAQVEADAAVVRAEQEELAELDATLRAQRAHWAETWGSLWHAADHAPATPQEMSDRLRDHQAALTSLTTLRDAEARVAALRSERAQLSQTLEEAARVVQTDPASSLDTLSDCFERTLEEARERVQQTTLRLERQRSLRGELAKVEQRLATLADDERQWQRVWSEALSPLGLEPDTSPKVALAVVELVKRLRNKLADAAQLERRIAGILRDHEQFVNDVRELARRARVELVAGEEHAVARRLQREFRSGRDAQEQAQRLDASLTEERSTLAQIESDAGNARAALDALFERAGVTTRELLSAKEAAFERRRELQQEVATLDATLADQLEGWTLERAQAELTDLDVDAARVRVQELEQEIADLEERWQDLVAQISSLDDGLARYAQSDAAQMSSEVQCALAQLRQDVARFTRVKLAQAVLTREVERYREQNQGPILARAEKLFVELTEGAYTHLVTRLDESDRPVLECVRDGKEVGVEGLSEGTRDQLYLALRLASYERAIASNPPLPLILDDVLTSFDNPRARAALRVLAEVAREGQVLLFTHHEHVVQLAREVVPSESLMTHALPRR